MHHSCEPGHGSRLSLFRDALNPSQTRSIYYRLSRRHGEQQDKGQCQRHQEEAVYCHRLGLMYNGRLIALGGIPDLRAGLKHAESYSMEDIFMAYIDRERAQAAGAALEQGV